MNDSTYKIVVELERKKLAYRVGKHGFGHRNWPVWWVNERFGSGKVALVGDSWFLKGAPDELFDLVTKTPAELTSDDLKICWGGLSGFRDIAPYDDARFDAEMRLWERCIKNYGEEAGNRLYELLYPIFFS